MVVHSVAAYRSPAFTGDITVTTGSVIDKFTDQSGPRPMRCDGFLQKDLHARRRRKVLGDPSRFDLFDNSGNQGARRHAERNRMPAGDWKGRRRLGQRAA